MLSRKETTSKDTPDTTGNRMQSPVTPCNGKRSENIILHTQDGITTLSSGNGQQGVDQLHFQNNIYCSLEVNQSRISPAIGKRRAYAVIQQTQSRVPIGKRHHPCWEEMQASPRVIAALCARAETWGTPKCPAARGRHEKKRYMCTVEYDAAVKKERPSPRAATLDGPTEGSTE